eukprot:10058045-Alexandrium_andersonii.AAC.1
MSASLVGSEMCIRDRPSTRRKHSQHSPALWHRSWIAPAMSPTTRCLEPVSYTHLTLPTICSV